mgnify:CR=1 FL=1
MLAGLAKWLAQAAFLGSGQVEPNQRLAVIGKKFS